MHRKDHRHLHKNEKRQYEKITRDHITVMIRAAIENGAGITGENPWHIDAGRHGILLRAEWNETASTLTVSITHHNWYVPRDEVWEAIDSLMNPVTKRDIP